MFSLNFMIPIYIIYLFLSSKNLTNTKEIINDLNYELNYLYYNDDKYKDLIDYNIDKYYYIKQKNINNQQYVDIKYKIRKYYLINDKIIKTSEYEKVTLKANELYNSNENNIQSCTSCGAPIDVTKRKCEYCNKKVASITKWNIEKID